MPFDLRNQPAALYTQSHSTHALSFTRTTPTPTQGRGAGEGRGSTEKEGVEGVKAEGDAGCEGREDAGSAGGPCPPRDTILSKRTTAPGVNLLGVVTSSYCTSARLLPQDKIDSAENRLALRCCECQGFEHGSWCWCRFLFQLADRVVDKATLAFEPSVVGRVSGARDGGDGDPAATAAANATQGSIDIASVSSALDWWESKRADIDERCHRITVEGKRCAMHICTCIVLFVLAVACPREKPTCSGPWSVLSCFRLQS